MRPSMPTASTPSAAIADASGTRAGGPCEAGRCREVSRFWAMSVAAPRTATERKADTLAMLGTPAIDVWVASADIVNGAMRAGCWVV
jgi:hypothetical protein